MSEYRPVEPFASDHLGTWCDHHGIDDYQFSSLSWAGFKIARDQKRDVSLAFKLREEIIDSLPLEGSELVRHPKARPEENWRPKVYQAPAGMAYEMTTRDIYQPTDDWGDPIDGEPRVVVSTIVGEFLEIETYVHRGKAVGRLIVREMPVYKAAPVLNLGGSMFVPDEDEMLKFPSKYDPSKVGDRVMFPRHDGWEVYTTGNKLEADYDKASVQLVPYERQEDAGLYAANFGSEGRFELDDFVHIPESPLTPDGYVYLPKPGGGSELTPTLGQLVLPPIDKEHWTTLWERHGIMIKYNPTVDDKRFVTLDFDQPDRVEFEMRKFNTNAKSGKTFMRAFAIRHEIGVTTLDDIVRTVSSNEELTQEDLNRLRNTGF